jgi:hypothetical protein
MDMIRVIVNRSLALREGLDESRALTLGMMGAMIGTPVVGYVTTMALARREAPEPVVAAGTGEAPAGTKDGAAPVSTPDDALGGKSPKTPSTPK